MLSLRVRSIGFTFRVEFFGFFFSFFLVVSNSKEIMRGISICKCRGRTIWLPFVLFSGLVSII